MLYVCEALDYLVRVAAGGGVVVPWPMIDPPTAQWVLDAAEVAPDVALVRAEIVTIETDDDEDPGDLGEAIERGIRPLTMDIEMGDA